MRIPILALAFAAALPNLVGQSTPKAVPDALEAERLEQSGTVITILFDDSGSMRGDKLDQAKRAFRDWLTTVPDNHRIGLIGLNAGQLVDWQRNNKSEVADAVARIPATGGTPLANTIELARRTIAERKADRPFERHVLLVFTDGEDSTSRGAKGVEEEVSAATSSGIEAVGIGFHGQGDYLKRSSTRYFDAANTDELRAGLATVDSEIGDTSDIVISPEIAEAMKTVSTTDIAPADPEPTSARSNESTTESEGPSFTWIIFAVIVYGIIRFVLRKKKKKR